VARDDSTEIMTPKESWINQCSRITETLSYCLEIVESIVGSRESDEGWKEGATLADQLEVELKMNLAKSQELAILLKQLKAKFK
jgi:hypothetical protein